MNLCSGCILDDSIINIGICVGIIIIFTTVISAPHYVELSLLTGVVQGGYVDRPMVEFIKHATHKCETSRRCLDD